MGVWMICQEDSLLGEVLMGSMHCIVRQTHPELAYRSPVIGGPLCKSTGYSSACHWYEGPGPTLK